MRSIVIETTWLKGLDHGWGNGYVILPKGHKWHGVNYDDIPVEVHGGLTFGEYASKLNNDFPLRKDEKDAYVIGFDTCHAWDTAEKWTKERVQDEADNLLEQCK